MKSLLDSIEFKKEKVNTYIILLSAPLLLTIYWYHGYYNRFEIYFKDFQLNPLFDFYKYLWQFVSFFLLMFIIPLIFTKYRLKCPLIEIGFGLGDKKFGLKLILIVIPFVVVPVIFLASKMPDVRSEYPLSKLLFSRKDLILWYELAYIIFYYIAWEFYFRGFLLFTLKNEFGNANAILIQTISSCLIHIGKPEGEILGSIVIGIIFGAIALRTNSFWYVFIIHSSIGVLTDIFIIFL
jgi:membrane protease YdiL (CAAX protease family)